MLMRKELEKREQETLAPYASFSSDKIKRITTSWENDLGESKNRTVWQLDRDRIIYTKAFKRLEYKTQVYLYRLSDHFRTRLTHSLEVSQISRELCRNLKLNEDLAEAISMAHDIGHTAFGHAGEKALDNKMKKTKYKGFCHNENSARVVIESEENYPDWVTGNKRYGINPTIELVDGIIKHSKRRRNPFFYKEIDLKIPSSLEGQCVAIADEIAQRSCDIYDALHMNIIEQEDIDELFKKLFGKNKLSFIKTKPNNKDEFIERKKESIDFSKEMKEKDEAIKIFLQNNIYKSDKVMILDYRGKKIIENLYDLYNEEINLIPKDYRDRINDKTDQELVIVDYISGMTDRFALIQYETIVGITKDP